MPSWFHFLFFVYINDRKEKIIASKCVRKIEETQCSAAANIPLFNWIVSYLCLYRHTKPCFGVMINVNREHKLKLNDHIYENGDT